jgi:glycosyltransferase involved in cell wall biosynthesis
MSKAAELMETPSAMSASSRNCVSARAARNSHHVLYVVDQLCDIGGAERILLNTVKRMDPDRFRASVVTFQVNPKLDVLSGISFPFHVLPLRSTCDLNAAKMAFRLRRLIRREHVSIVHTFFETSDLWAAPIARLSGCPVLISSRRDMGIYRNRKHRLAYRLVNPIFDRVLAVSNQVRSFCIDHDGLPLEKVETLYNGVDLDELSVQATEFDASVALDLRAGAPIILTVANIRPVKGLDILIRAAARVCREFSEATFVIVGSVLIPETYRDLKNLVDALDLKRNVKFVGRLVNPYPVLRTSSLFCLPSRNEGFSNALIEAMGCRLPCVVTKVGGNAEAIDNAKTGFVVPSEDVEEMADRILRLLRDPEMARRMGQAARSAVEQRFSAEAMMTRLMAIYDELLVAKSV